MKQIDASMGFKELYQLNIIGCVPYSYQGTVNVWKFDLLILYLRRRKNENIPISIFKLDIT